MKSIKEFWQEHKTEIIIGGTAVLLGAGFIFYKNYCVINKIKNHVFYFAKNQPGTRPSISVDEARDILEANRDIPSRFLIAKEGMLTTAVTLDGGNGFVYPESMPQV